MQTTDHVHSDIISQAAEWYFHRQQEGECHLISALKARFDLTAADVVEVLKLADAMRQEAGISKINQLHERRSASY